MSANSSARTSTTLPTDGAWDATVSLLREGYHFIPNRCRRLGSDIFRTRLTLTDVICMQGPQAAELFYGDAPLTRRQAMPQTVLRLLQDKGSVQQLDGVAHRHRKALFISILTAPEQAERLSQIFQEEWLARLSFWQKQKRVVLFEEVNLILTRAACRWAGVPIGDSHAMATELAGMVEHAGHFRLATFAALWRRRRTERHVRKLVEQIRLGDVDVASDMPVRRVAAFRDIDGQMLSAEAAAVEIINMLRP
ncbi:MAG: cytochrome P450, partial [Pseudorhizobium sp.]